MTEGVFFKKSLIVLQLEKLLHSPHIFTLFFIAHFLIEHIFEQSIVLEL